MQLEIRLKKILREHNLFRHGIEQRLARDLNVHRHTIGKLCRNQVSNPSLDILGDLCDWLQGHGVPAEDLPQTLLGSRPADLWEAVAGLQSVRVYLGEYHQMAKDGPTMLWISRRDSIVASELVQILSTPAESGEHRPTVLLHYVPFRFGWLGAHVTKKQFGKDIVRTREMFTEMRSRGGHSTSILVGSQRVNYLVEHLVADLFGCEPFHPVENSPKVPFYLSYRDRDRAVPSCFGGLRNPPGRRGRRAPGTYYLDDKGKWICCPWISKKEDAGIIITAYDPGTKGVEMAVFGFSGRGTEAIGRQLLHDADPFWEPYAKSRDKKVGVYVCQFKTEAETSADAGEIIHARDFKVVHIEKEVLEKYLR